MDLCLTQNGHDNLRMYKSDELKELRNDMRDTLIGSFYENRHHVVNKSCFSILYKRIEAWSDFMG
jgi:hypothetical protein